MILSAMVVLGYFSFYNIYINEYILILLLPNSKEEEETQENVLFLKKKHLTNLPINLPVIIYMSC